MSTSPNTFEPPIHPHGALHSPSPTISSHSSHGGPYQPLHDSVASATCPYPYPVICSVPSSQRACKDACKGKSKAHSGPSKPHYDASFRLCNTPPLSQAGYKSPSPVPHAGPSTPAPSVSLADLSAPTAAPAAPATSTSRLAPEASLFLSYVQLLNDFEHWESHGWRAGECHEHLWMLSTIFRSSEVIGKRMYDQVGTAEGSFKVHTFEAIDWTSSSVLQEALKMQEAIVKIVHEDYGPSLISSFHSFLDRLPVDIVVHGLFPPSPSMGLPTTGLTSSPRPKEVQLEEPSSTLFRHQEIFRLLPSSQYLSPPSARENLVGSFPSIGSIPYTNLPATNVHALDIGHLTAQLAVATNLEICSWVEQGLYLPLEDLRP
ncbi:hypothetical protein M404DRAFT_34293 [Pisolithus tinctorius Marx 270]|uniref:Uncharacterized protein n=1 Tax=Pisolithus tinctorius Marx 270 TaxID=870435 RepID=A0A0C3JC53_PISTI|nr:hypothetical protein M404DRAFT_34293 [Pisolithus tinctorius Marx 270]